MLTPHPSSHLSPFLCGTLVLCCVLLAMASVAQAQTQASCTFKLFQPAFSGGVNDWGTVVGERNRKAAIRYAGGGISYYLPPVLCPVSSSRAITAA